MIHISVPKSSTPETPIQKHEVLEHARSHGADGLRGPPRAKVSIIGFRVIEHQRVSRIGDPKDVL